MSYYSPPETDPPNTPNTAEISIDFPFPTVTFGPNGYSYNYYYDYPISIENTGDGDSFQQRMQNFNIQLSRIHLQINTLNTNFTNLTTNFAGLMSDFSSTEQNSNPNLFTQSPVFPLSPFSRFPLSSSSRFLNTLEDLIQYTELEPQPQEDIKVTISEDDFNTLDTFRCTANLNENCSICYDEFKFDEIITLLDCNHIFHRECIKNWLVYEKTTCPACRVDVRDSL